MDRRETREIIIPLLDSNHRNTEYSPDYSYKIEHYGKGDLLVAKEAMSLDVFIEMIKKNFPGTSPENIIIHAYGCTEEIKVHKNKY